MTDEKRFLQKPCSYYEYAQQQSITLGIFNQTTLQEDFHLHMFWSRYIHYCAHQRYHPNTNLHSHSFFELHCILNGVMLYSEADSAPREISAGNFVLIAPKNQHSLKRITPDAESFAVAFEPICKDTDQGKKLQMRFDSITSIASALDSETYQLIELIMQEFHDNQAFCTQNVKSLLNILILNLIRTVFVEKQFNSAHLPLYDARLINLEKYIADNPNCFFSVSELAEYLNISVRHLNNIINDQLGVSAKSFIDARKAKQAQKLLLETDLNLQQISEQLGFADHNNFNRFFKRIEGMSPGSFRRSKGDFKDNKNN